MKKFSELGKVITGKTPPTCDKANYGEGYMFITPAELHEGFEITSSDKHITEKGLLSIKANSINGTSVLVGCIGWDMGNVAICHEKCATNQQINSITEFKKDYNPYYVYYWLLTKKEFLFSLASITRTPILSKGEFQEVTIPVPDRFNQDKIVDVLQIIDKKIQCNNRINRNLQNQLKLIYDYWFTQFDFPDLHGKPYRSSGGEMVWNAELQREIPVGWECKTLGDLLVENCESFDFSRIEPTIDLSVMPSSSISLHKLNSSDKFTTNLFIMHEGDILFGSIRPYLKKAGIAPCDGVVAGTVFSYRTIVEDDYNFALFTLCRDSFFEYALAVSKGTKMPVVDSDHILAYKVPYSSRIAKLFNRHFCPFRYCKSIFEKAIA
ncbi:MAG: restriction endonuclease subunit S, partial [Bacteroidales bacterium]|nr:restriction endonuclease subunit S [Bacteroidales bacterium]